MNKKCQQKDKNNIYLTDQRFHGLNRLFVYHLKMMLLEKHTQDIFFRKWK